MPEKTIFLVAILLILPTMPAAAQEAKSPDGTIVPADEIEGVWELSEVRMGNHAVNDFSNEESPTITFRDGLLRYGPGPDEPMKYRLDTTTNPKRLTVIRDHDGEPVEDTQIYKLEEDLLTICGEGPDGEMPKDFEPAEGKYVQVLRRCTESELAVSALEQMGVTITRVDELGPGFVPDSESIRITLDETVMTEEGMIAEDSMRLLKKVEHLALDFGFAAIGDAVIRQLTALSNLEWLALGLRPEMTDADLDFLTRCEGLRVLELRGERFDEAKLKIVARMEKLQGLALAGREIAPEGLALLGQCDELRHLALMTDGGIADPERFPSLPELKSLGRNRRSAG